MCKAGADPGFFLGEGALVSCSTSTPINHIVFSFFCRIPVVLENRRSSHGGVRTPLHPPPRSAPVRCPFVLINLICIFFSALVTLLKYMAASLALMKAFSKRLYGEIFIFTPNQSVSLKEHRPKPRSHYLCSLCWRTCGLCMMLY